MGKRSQITAAANANGRTIKKVAIVGGGFGGLNAAKLLGNKAGVEVEVFDGRNHHLFQPLLYQVATAGLSPADIAAPIRSVLAPFANTRVHLAQVTGVDPVQNVLHSEAGSFRFDYLILACGATHSYFGREEWEPFAPGLKTLEQATEIRRRILLAFEQAENEPDPVVRKRLLTFVVVGGGPTGVELAGAAAELGRFTLARDFRVVDPTQTQVILVEAGPRVLGTFSESLSIRAQKDLTELGVHLRLGARVTAVDAEGVDLGGERIQAATVLWAAGVEPSGLNAHLGVELDRVGRVLVEPQLVLAKFPSVFVIGDQAAFRTPNGGYLPGLAPVAIQQGAHAARNILRSVSGKPMLAFVYRDKGQMATIGRRRAVVQSGGWEFGGGLAWLAWLGVHIYYLIGFRNRVFVLLSWAWAYLNFSRGARLIVGKQWKLTKE